MFDYVITLILSFLFGFAFAHFKSIFPAVIIIIIWISALFTIKYRTKRQLLHYLFSSIGLLIGFDIGLFYQDFPSEYLVYGFFLFMALIITRTIMFLIKEKEPKTKTEHPKNGYVLIVLIIIASLIRLAVSQRISDLFAFLLIMTIISTVYFFFKYLPKSNSWANTLGYSLLLTLLLAFLFVIFVLLNYFFR